MTLTGHIVLVTGAAGTLGRATCAAVRAAGGTVLATDLVAGEGIDLAHDVAEEADWARVIAEAETRHGRLDGLVNNAGIVRLGSIEDTSLADWQRVIAVNADGVFLGCKLAWPLLKRSRAASIVNLSSASGIIGGANLAAYNASKGAVRLLTKSVALHGARLDPPIRCNSVHPAFVEGAMVDGIAGATRGPRPGARQDGGGDPAPAVGEARGGDCPHPALARAGLRLHHRGGNRDRRWTGSGVIPTSDSDRERAPALPRG